jgi:malonate transporter
LQNLIVIAGLVVPVFLIVALGYLLKKLGMITDDFVKLSSRIVFTVSLPALIFTEISKTDFTQILNLKLIGFAYLGTLVTFSFVWLISIPLVRTATDRTVFIQGSFRGNMAIIGLALIANVYGINSLGQASLLLAFTIPVYNTLSVIALTVPLRKERHMNIGHTAFEIIKNPLVLAVIFSIPFSYFKIELPGVAEKTINYLAVLALPLALLGIGGFMNFSELKKGFSLSVLSSVMKLILFPLAMTYAAYLLNFRGYDLGILFILFACPTAIASFIMAEAMGSNSKLAANILLITTLASLITITIGLFILKENNLI